MIEIGSDTRWGMGKELKEGVSFWRKEWGVEERADHRKWVLKSRWRYSVGLHSGV